MKRFLLLTFLLLVLGACGLEPAQPGPSYARDGRSSRLVWAVEDFSAGEEAELPGYVLAAETEERRTYRTDPLYAGESKPRIRTLVLRRVKTERLAERIAGGTVDLAVTDDGKALVAARDAGWQIFPAERGKTVLLAPGYVNFDPGLPLPEALYSLEVAWE